MWKVELTKFRLSIPSARRGGTSKLWNKRLWLISTQTSRYGRWNWRRFACPSHPLAAGHLQTLKQAVAAQLLLFFISILSNEFEDGYKKQKDVFRHLLVSKFGWKMGFEPTTFGTTIRHSNRLSYIHHLDSISRIGCKYNTLFYNVQIFRQEKIHFAFTEIITTFVIYHANSSNTL